MTTRLLLIGVAIFLTATGCEEDNPRLGVDVDPSCNDASDCADGQDCVDQQCRDAAVDCDSDEDCPEGESCVDGICDGRADEDCEVDSDCRTGEICDGGICIEDPSAECDSDEDCPDGYTCQDGLCRTLDPECEGDSDCPDGEVCIDSQCQEMEPECVEDEDCPDGEICNAGQCQQPVGCESNDDCDPNQICDDGTCRDQVCVPGTSRCQENNLIQCSDDGLEESQVSCEQATVCLVDPETSEADCVAQVCEPGSISCEDATTTATCNDTGTGQALDACPEGLYCTDGVCAERNCEPFEIGCLDNGTAYACTEEGTIEPLPCADNQYCLDAQCYDRVCEPDSISCEADTLVSCDELGTEQTRVDCNAEDNCGDNPLGCTCADNACAPRICEPGTLRCQESTAQTCDELGVSWQDVETCTEEQLCQEGSCLDIVCEPGAITCDGESLVECNENGTNETRTDCADEDQLCDAEAASCVDRLCEPGSRVCNGDTVFACSDRGDSFESLETCEDNERCRGGECRSTCEPGETRCNDNIRYVCLDDGVNEEAQDCGDDSVCLDGECEPVVCDEGERGCDGTVITQCNETRTGFDATDADCAENQQVCQAGQCVRVNLCPTTVVTASAEDAGVDTRSGEIVVPAQSSLLLDGTESTDDTNVARVQWRQVEGPEGAEIEAGDDPLTANVTGMGENQRYVFEGTAIDEDDLESCEPRSIEVFTVSDDRLVVHLTWHDEADNNEYDNRGADADLHMVKAAEGRWTTEPFSVYYRERNPEWNPENPSLLDDDTNGRGPETITMDNPDDCQWYAVGAGFFQNPFQSSITLGWNVFVDGQLRYSSYDRELEVGDFVSELLIHHDSGEVFEVGQIIEELPSGERPAFSSEAIESELCGIPDDVVPPSCEDALGDITDPDSAADFGSYPNLTVCADEPDYFGTVNGTGNVLMAQITTNADSVQAQVVDGDDTVVGEADENGGIWTVVPNDDPHFLRVLTSGEGPDVYSVRSIACDEDDLAPNQSPETAQEFSDGEHGDLTICGTAGADWFFLDMEIGDSLTVTTQTGVQSPPHIAALLDPDQEVLLEEDNRDPEKVLSTGQVNAAGRYWVKISAAGTLDIVSYDLVVEISRARIGIDLTALNIQSSTDTLIRKSSIEVSSDLANLGARGATFSTARIQLRTPFERFEILSPTLDPFPAQSTRTESFEISVPEDLEPGEYDLCFEVDAEDTVPEINEENNIACRQVEVNECVDAFEPNSTGEQALESGADWFEAVEQESMDTCPAQDVDVYYATVQAGDHEFCVETSNGEWVSFRLYEEGNVVPLVNRNGPRPCIQVEADEEVRYFFSVWQLGPRNRVEYEVTYEER